MRKAEGGKQKTPYVSFRAELDEASKYVIPNECEESAFPSHENLLRELSIALIRRASCRSRSRSTVNLSFRTNVRNLLFLPKP